jgi:hypothetical protein
MLGAATETIVWSMKVIATAKIIAVRTRARFVATNLGTDMCGLTVVLGSECDRCWGKSRCAAMAS